MKRSLAQFLIDVASFFRLRPQSDEYRGVSKETFLSLFRGTIPENIPADQKLQQIQGLLQKEVSRPVPGQPARPEPEVLNLLDEYQQHSADIEASKVELNTDVHNVWKENFNTRLETNLKQNPIPLKGVFGEVGRMAGEQVVGGLVKKGIGKLAKTGLAKLLKKGVQFLASKIAGIAASIVASPIVGALASQVATKVIPLLKRNWKKVMAGLTAAGLAVVGGVPGAAIGLGVILVAFPGLLGAALGAMIAPAVVVIVAIPLIVAVILFIINSGAYIVPPAPSFVPGAITSPYIGIEKTADPNCMNRAGCPSFGPVEYTVKIYAKKGSLSNIQIRNQYKVIGESNAAEPNPEIEALNDLPQTISPGQGFTFTYSLNLGTEYDNSIIIDSLTVTANTSEQKGATASTNASVVIGNPPIDCPVPGGRMRGALDGSYDSGREIGHGSNEYWIRVGGSCRYALPQGTGCRGPLNSPGNICSGQANRCSYYGYAIDVFPSGSTDVLAPRVLGEETIWVYDNSFSNGRAGWSHVYLDSNRGYTIVFTHLKREANYGTSIPSGAKIGELFNLGGNTHLHLEFAINGVYVRPEEYFCF